MPGFPRDPLDIPSLPSQLNFLQPRLTGARFEGGVLPLEVLRDFSAFEEMIVEVAKWSYMQANPARRRSPRGFKDSVALAITGVEEGSAIPAIALVWASATLFPPHTTYFENARDRVLHAIDAAGHGEDPTNYFPPNLLSYFDRVGRSLRPDEAIYFRPTSPDQPSRLDATVRRRLVLSSSQAERITNEVRLRGTVPEADQQKKTFTLKLPDGTRLPGAYESQHEEDVLNAFHGYRSSTRVLVHGIGRFAAERIQALDVVEHVTVLEENDVAARLDELRALSEGWLDGEGAALSSGGLEWLAAQFDTAYADDLPLPYIYPTPAGGVQAEWSFSGVEVALEIDLGSKAAYWHSTSMNEEGQEQEEELDLGEGDAWTWLAREIRALKDGDSSDV